MEEMYVIEPNNYIDKNRSVSEWCQPRTVVKVVLMTLTTIMNDDG
jgi:hypothetical protein